MCAAVAFTLRKHLKTDVKKVDTKLAEVYCEQHSSKFSNPGKLIDFIDNVYCEREPAVYTELIKKLKENTELFCQLEYKARCVQMDEVKSRDIELIIQNLLYSKSHPKQEQFIAGTDISIFFNKTTPLSTLGLVAQLRKLSIHCNYDSAPICYLFTSLCHEVGFTNVSLDLEFSVPGIDSHSIGMDIAQLKCIRAGCAGVIAERSDLDSAVDTFIATSTMNPWKLQRVFVQESVYEDLKRVLEWKMKLETGNTVLHFDDDLETQCRGAFKCGGKLFLLDYLGAPGHLEDDPRNIVLVEAYRTNKELLSLINERRPYCVSLWASDISEANEIAFGVKAHVVWINDFGTFDGPINASQSFYSVVLSECCSTMLELDKFKALVNLHESWMKLSVDERRKVMLEAFDEIETNGNLYKEIIDEIRENIIEHHETYKEGIVQIKKNKMCICIDGQFEILTLHSLSELSKFTKNAITRVMDGNGIVVDVGSETSYILEIFKRKGIPIVDTDFIIYTKIQASRKVKTIWSNFGTTFAN